MTEQRTTCPYGCIFFPSGGLVGDCRAPSQEDCELNRRDRDREARIKRRERWTKAVWWGLVVMGPVVVVWWNLW